MSRYKSPANIKNSQTLKLSAVKVKKRSVTISIDEDLLYIIEHMYSRLWRTDRSGVIQRMVNEWHQSNKEQHNPLMTKNNSEPSE